MTSDQNGSILNKKEALLMKCYLKYFFCYYSQFLYAVKPHSMEFK